MTANTQQAQIWHDSDDLSSRTETCSLAGVCFLKQGMMGVTLAPHGHTWRQRLGKGGKCRDRGWVHSGKGRDRGWAHSGKGRDRGWVRAVRAETEAGCTAVSAETEAEHTAVRAETEAEHTAVRAETEAGRTAVRAETEAGCTAVRAETEAGCTAVSAETEAEHTAVRAETEAGCTAVSAETEAGCTAVSAETVAEHTAVRAEAEAEHTAVRAETEAGCTAVSAETETGCTAVSAETEAEHTAVRAEAEAEHTAVRAETEAGCTAVSAETEAVLGCVVLTQTELCSEECRLRGCSSSQIQSGPCPGNQAEETHTLTLFTLRAKLAGERPAWEPGSGYCVNDRDRSLYGLMSRMCWAPLHPVSRCDDVIQTQTRKPARSCINTLGLENPKRVIGRRGSSRVTEKHSASAGLDQCLLITGQSKRRDSKPCAGTARQPSLHPKPNNHRQLGRPSLPVPVSGQVQEEDVVSGSQEQPASLLIQQQALHLPTAHERNDPPRGKQLCSTETQRAENSLHINKEESF
ncbi:hypothetical protein JZ751_025672 [Albula glossodonta]|uniref:Uncharacterized protein n=1 Tax=Albula glossodonta TaxID=121402 RepID=A0A8T2MPK5_9TELE|nr:hypothetical protein JZ751_025672 [Albula glossodonta]